jgi:hypothetical protein
MTISLSEKARDLLARLWYAEPNRIANLYAQRGHLEGRPPWGFPASRGPGPGCWNIGLRTNVNPEMIASENLTARQRSILKKVCCEIVAKSRVAPFIWEWSLRDSNPKPADNSGVVHFESVLGGLFYYRTRWPRKPKDRSVKSPELRCSTCCGRCPAILSGK